MASYTRAFRAKTVQVIASELLTELLHALPLLFPALDACVFTPAPP